MRQGTKNYRYSNSNYILKRNTIYNKVVTEWHLDAAEHTVLRKKVCLVSCFYLTSRWLKYLHSAVWELQLFSVASVFYCAGASNTTHDHHHDVHTAQRPLHVTSSLGAVCTSIPSIVQSLRTFKCLPSRFSFAIRVRTHYCFISSHEKAPNRFHTDLQFFQRLYAK